MLDLKNLKNEIYLPSRFKTLTGTKTEGGDGCVGPTCRGGGIVEQYSIGLLGFGLLNEDISSSTKSTKTITININLKTSFLQKKKKKSRLTAKSFYTSRSTKIYYYFKYY